MAGFINDMFRFINKTWWHDLLDRVIIYHGKVENAKRRPEELRA